MAVGLADEQKMPAAGQDRLAQRLIGIEIVAQIDRVGPQITRAMGDEPTASMKGIVRKASAASLNYSSPLGGL